MRLLTVVPWAGTAAGGAAAAAVTTSRLLATAGHAVTLCATDAASPSNARGTARLTPAAIEDLEARLHPASLRLFAGTSPRRLAWSPALDAWLDTAVPGVDLLNIHTLWLHPTASAMRHARRAGRPYLVWPHGALSPAFRQRGRLRKAVAQRLFQRDGMAGAAGVVVASEIEAGWLTDVPAAVRRVVVPHAVDIDAMPSTGHARVPGRMIWAGRLGPVKRPDLAIELLAEAGPGQSLVIAGPDGSALRPALEARAAALGVAHRITWTGDLSRRALHDLIAGAELTLVTSDSENFSLVAAESAALGTPVAARRTVGALELLGALGAAITLDDEPSIAGPQTERLLADPAAWNEAHEASGRVREALAPAAIAGRLDTLVREAVA